jgi:hypothetical protein
MGFPSHYGPDMRGTNGKSLLSLMIRPNLTCAETLIQMGMVVFVPWEKRREVVAGNSVLFNSVQLYLCCP